MTALIPDAIRCSFNFPGHTPHWGRVRNQMTPSRRESGQRIISVVQTGPTSLLVATQYGTVTAYRNHEPARLVKIWTLYPEAGRLYTAEGFIGVKHQVCISGSTVDAEYLFSVTQSGYRTCLEIQEDMAQFKVGQKST